ncbi:MAG: DMT family transporter [Deltaproteobacteria bacterium]|nr:DMT family transporter [Deltaproteobacteria bacterium]
MNPDFFHSGEFYSLTCAVLWAVGLVLYSRSGDFLSPLALNVFKSGVGLVLFLATMVVLGHPFFPEERTHMDWLITVGSGVVGIGVADTVLFAGLNRVGAGRFAILDCVYSPSVVLCSFLYLSEPMPAVLFLSMGLMIVAILLGAWEPYRGPSDKGDSRRRRLGILYGIIGIFLTAASIVLVKPVLEKSNIWWVATIRLSAGFAVLLVHATFSRHRAEIARLLTRPTTWKVAFPAALFGTYLAFFFWNLGMKHTYTTVASVLNQTSILFILLLSWLFLKEQLGVRQWVSVIIGFGAAVLIIL